ncbi:MAG: DUF5010 domain-containing protein [Verrucomicrobiales bacterium]|nr:DUF5010 domain-containing protein [Verrucomicrobiales bacterium]
MKCIPLLAAAILAHAAPSSAGEPSGSRPIPPAYGPHTGLAEKDFAGAVSFKSTDRIVGTHYFYWYDSVTGAHIRDGDGSDALTTHPPSLEDISFRSTAWHRRQLEDMSAAGIDFLLAVFWGAPSEQPQAAGLHWSYAGLPPLVAAREELLREGKSPPRIGLFYDTSTLQHNAWNYHADLTTDYGRRWFYATVRDFFSLIPPRHWAMVDNRPIVLLYSAAFALRHDQSVIDFTKQAFPADFGGRVPWIGRDVSWQVRTDGTVAWGGALGLRTPGIASLGPGYDHSAVPGRTPLIVDRRGGAFYEENWMKLLRRPANMVMLETWNEFHEGTDIAESREYGRHYIELTKKYADWFRKGYVPPREKGRYSGSASVSFLAGARHPEQGLRLIANPDGMVAVEPCGDRMTLAIRPAAGQGAYIYFGVDDSFKPDAAGSFALEVDYFDAAAGRLDVDFDGSNAEAPFSGAYSPSGDTVDLTGSKTWRTARFRLDGARFNAGQNSGADFRLVIAGAPQFAIGTVTLRRDANHPKNSAQ